VTQATDPISRRVLISSSQQPKIDELRHSLLHLWQILSLVAIPCTSSGRRPHAQTYCRIMAILRASSRQLRNMMGSRSRRMAARRRFQTFPSSPRNGEVRTESRPRVLPSHRQLEGVFARFHALSLRIRRMSLVYSPRYPDAHRPAVGDTRGGVIGRGQSDAADDASSRSAVIVESLSQQSRRYSRRIFLQV
jgi:hypothetical protein